MHRLNAVLDCQVSGSAEEDYKQRADVFFGSLVDPRCYMPGVTGSNTVLSKLSIAGPIHDLEQDFAGSIVKLTARNEILRLGTQGYEEDNEDNNNIQEEEYTVLDAIARLRRFEYHFGVHPLFHGVQTDNGDWMEQLEIDQVEEDEEDEEDEEEEDGEGMLLPRLDKKKKKKSSLWESDVQLAEVDKTLDAVFGKSTTVCRTATSVYLPCHQEDNTIYCKMRGREFSFCFTTSEFIHDIKRDENPGILLPKRGLFNLRCVTMCSYVKQGTSHRLGHPFLGDHSSSHPTLAHSCPFQ